MRIVLYTLENASIHFLFDPQTLPVQGQIYYISPKQLLASLFFQVIIFPLCSNLNHLNSSFLLSLRI